jgi:hypothetical protein
VAFRVTTLTGQFTFVRLRKGSVQWAWYGYGMKTDGVMVEMPEDQGLGLDLALKFFSKSWCWSWKKGLVDITDSGFLACPLFLL